MVEWLRGWWLVRQANRRARQAIRCADGDHRFRDLGGGQYRCKVCRARRG